MIDIKMSTVVLVLNQDGITELIETANNLQTKIDNVMSTGVDGKNKDRIADAGAATSFLEAAKEKLPIIMEEGDESGVEGDVKASTVSTTTSSSESHDVFFLLLFCMTLNYFLRQFLLFH